MQHQINHLPSAKFLQGRLLFLTSWLWFLNSISNTASVLFSNPNGGQAHRHDKVPLAAGPAESALTQCSSLVPRITLGGAPPLLKEMCDLHLASKSAEGRNVSFQQCYLIAFRGFSWTHWDLCCGPQDRGKSANTFIRVVSKALADPDMKAIANTSVPTASFPWDSSAEMSFYFLLSG